MTRRRARNPKEIAPGRRPARPPARGPAGRARISPASGPRRAPRQARARQLVDALVEAAAQLLVERGYGGASTNALAERAGVSVGSLYQYFTGKADLFRELTKRHQAEVHPLIDRALEALDDGREPPGPVVEALLHDLMDLHGRRPALMRAMDTQLGHVRSEAGQLEEAEAATALAGILQRRGAGSPDECRASAWLLAVVISTVSRHLVHSPPEGLDQELVVRGVGRMVAGLLGRPAGD